ncbi:hypothetical protein E2320_000961 [Naja naja]|nr:hypothetical protein E2320_000961 [Naja naja]
MAIASRLSCILMLLGHDINDSQPPDGCIQNILCGLYPPSESTSARFRFTVCSSSMRLALLVQEKIVIQPASLDWWILRPENFYLQVVLYLRKSPWIIVKSLAKEKHSVEEFVASAALCASLFTVEWLSSVIRKWLGTTLENCFLATEGVIF